MEKFENLLDELTEWSFAVKEEQDKVQNTYFSLINSADHNFSNARTNIASAKLYLANDMLSSAFVRLRLNLPPAFLKCLFLDENFNQGCWYCTFCDLV